MSVRVFVQDPAEVQPPEMAVFMGETPPYAPARASAESRRLADILRERGLDVIAPAAMLAGRDAGGVPLEKVRALARAAVAADHADRARLADSAISAWGAADLASVILKQPTLELVADDRLGEISPDSFYEFFRIAPLFGLMFPRDHFISLGRTAVPGRLVRQDRARETAVMAACLRAAGAAVRELPPDPALTLEGGDFASNKTVSIINTGFRTAPGAADWLVSSGLVETRWCLVLTDKVKRPAEFHLDHFLALGPGFVLASRERLDDRRVCECSVLRVIEGRITTHMQGATLRQALEAAGLEVLPLESDELDRFEANALFLGRDLMIAPETLSPRVASLVGARGVEVVTIPFGEHHKQFGSVHCAAHPFEVASGETG